ncbi:hypothetical protein P154DRAFT_528101 [Amniculicola lignicola CBS 123094]|uniref:Azaphilone pigments biosynthesis cluster protein L N-terminal domain-containing protein n=1 Tax=Amniculicola lignicola CBS 123094 TaxID=1392246 RepID=A0A6A5VUD8_9PLEO|nr:hypothetical protein P154DRAFT_528101 [Amniculicola lignicola CBS 123094]
MDPVSIAAAAASITATSLKISYALYTFVNDVRDIDNNVKALHDEILGLSRVSDAIQRAWARDATVIASRAKEDGCLWIAVQESLLDCDGVVQRLKVTIERASKSGGIGRILTKKVSKTIKLNLREKEVEQYRRQIHTHCNAMQTGLSTIQISLQLSNKAEQASMIRSLEELRQHMIGMREAIEPGGVYDTFSNLPDSEKRTAKALRHFVQQAESFHSSSSTVVGDTRSTVWSGSVIGDPLSLERIKNIREWIPPPIEELPTDMEPIEKRTAADFLAGSPPTRRPDTDAQKSSSSTVSQKSVVAGKFFDIALKKLEQQDFGGAEGFFIKFMLYSQHLDRGTDASSPGDDSPTSRLHWGKVLLFYTYCVQDAWEAAQKFHDESVITDRTLLQQYAPYLVDIESLMDYHMGRNREAMKSQEALYEYKCKHYGATSEFTLFTVSVLVSLYEENEDFEEVEVFSTFLPPDYEKPDGAGRNTHIQRYLKHIVLPGPEACEPSQHQYLESEESRQDSNSLQTTLPVGGEKEGNRRPAKLQGRATYVEQADSSPDVDGINPSLEWDERFEHLFENIPHGDEVSQSTIEDVVLSFWDLIKTGKEDRLDKHDFTLCGYLQHPKRPRTPATAQKPSHVNLERRHVAAGTSPDQEPWDKWWSIHLKSVRGFRIDEGGVTIMVTLENGLYLWHIPTRKLLGVLSSERCAFLSADFDPRAKVVVVLLNAGLMSPDFRLAGASSMDWAGVQVHATALFKDEWTVEYVRSRPSYRQRPTPVTGPKTMYVAVRSEATQLRRRIARTTRGPYIFELSNTGSLKIWDFSSKRVVDSEDRYSGP